MGMSRRLSESDAIKLMNDAGLIPLVQYVSVSTPWLSRCRKCKREVSPRLASIKRGSAGCSYCSGNKVDPHEAFTIMQKAGYQPQVSYPGNDVPWRCICIKCKKETFPRFHGVKSRGDGCKYCSGKVVLLVDALKDMKEKGLTPLVDFPGASKPWKSQCKKCGNQTSPRLADLRMGHSGCKRCGDEVGGKKRRLVNNPTRAGKTTVFEDVIAVMRNANLEPLEPYETSQTKWKCKCLKCGEIVAPRYTTILQGGGGCMNCSRVEQVGRGRLDEQAAIAVMRGKNLEPLEAYPGAMIPWKVKCLDCGNYANPRYAHIQQGRKGCKQCGYKKNADSNRTSQSEAIKVARASGFEPLEPYRGRHYPWRCKCKKCGEIVSPHYSGIVTGGGCRYCSGLVVDPTEAIKVMNKANLQPLVTYPGAGQKWLSKCLKCGKEVTPRYSQVKFKNSGCKFCATYGYDFSQSGILYLITNEKLRAHKIGITNASTKEKRIGIHQKNGWEIYKTSFYLDGNDAFEIEQEILLWWRNDLGLPQYLSSSEMPRGGQTETVDAGEIDLVTIWNRIEAITKQPKQIRNAQLSPKTTMPKKQKSTTKNGFE